jgi:hypothetical protein
MSGGQRGGADAADPRPETVVTTRKSTSPALLLATPGIFLIEGDNEDWPNTKLHIRRNSAFNPPAETVGYGIGECF